MNRDYREMVREVEVEEEEGREETKIGETEEEEDLKLLSQKKMMNLLITRSLATRSREADTEDEVEEEEVEVMTEEEAIEEVKAAEEAIEAEVAEEIVDSEAEAETDPPLKMKLRVLSPSLPLNDQRNRKKKKTGPHCGRS